MAETEKRDAERDMQSLRSRPQRQNRRAGISLLGVLGAVIILAVLAFVGWTVVGSGQGNPSGSRSGAKTGANATATIVGENDPVVYWNTLEQQIAESLRLSVSDIQSKVRAEALGNGSKSSGNVTPPIVMMAAQQNWSGSRWRTVEINAIQKADQALVSIHALTQQQADQRVQDARSWTQGNLDGYINYAFSSR